MADNHIDKQPPESIVSVNMCSLAAIDINGLDSSCESTTSEIHIPDKLYIDAPSILHNPSNTCSRSTSQNETPKYRHYYCTSKYTILIYCQYWKYKQYQEPKCCYSSTQKHEQDSEIQAVSVVSKPVILQVQAVPIEP